MKTTVLKTDENSPEKEVIFRAADIIKQGGLVAFPTETVYGLGANGLDEAACAGIYEAKGRPSDNPLILHICGEDMLLPLVKNVPESAKKLAEAFWPGPLTIIYPKSDIVPESVTGGLKSVAVRFPSNKIAVELIRAAGVPIAAPSANSSGKPSPTRASHVEFDLGGKIELILDGGAADWGLESTIVDASVSPPALLRPGAITLEMLKEVLGEINVDPAVFGKEAEAPRAPGMKYTHYSPLADVILASGSLKEQAAKINEAAKRDIAEGKKVGILATDESLSLYKAGEVRSAGSRKDYSEIGAMLFKLLRKFDYLGADVVYCESFDTAGEGLAIMNRLKKAACKEI
ncbi:MAG: threonylcarbamoyl-AMP synthase [Firmicutes bacterium]|nr:threonylcarbamoyl-AMP synthase [Bacillota bacterium]